MPAIERRTHAKRPPERRKEIKPYQYRGKRVENSANGQAGRKLGKLKGRLHVQTVRRRGNALFLFLLFVRLVLVNDFLNVVSN